MSISADLIDDLDAKALKTALDIQIPLREHLGTVRSSLIGMHAYLHALTHNTAHIDYLLQQIEPYQEHWHEKLTLLIHKCASQRLDAGHCSDLTAVYRAQAVGILTLANDLFPDSPKRIETLKRYQVYACEDLLGSKERPAFFTTEELTEFTAPQSRLPAVLFIRQFFKRLGKPELIRRELSRHFALLDDPTPELTLNLIDEVADHQST